jgi:hypothetical protein
MVLAQADTAAPAAEPANTVVAEPTEPVMEAEPAALAAAPAQDDVVGAGLSEGETLVPTEPAPATSLMAEPALAEPAMTEPATTEPAMSEPAAVVEPAQSQPPAAIEAGPASGADPVAYPEWMAPIRFE